MMQPASVALRSFYCVALACFIWPIATATWLGLALAGGVIGAIAPVLSMAFVVLGLWRIFQVVTRPETLDSYVYSGIVKVLRVLGTVGMVLSVISLTVQMGFGAYLNFLGPKAAERSGDVYVVAVYLSLLGGFAQCGLWIFEISRLLGLERNNRGEN